MRYMQRLPCPALRSLVRFYWMVEHDHDEGMAAETVIPDGCMEMIFHFGAPCRSTHDGDRQVSHPRAFVGGQITRSIQVQPTGPLGMLGVRFFPFGARPLLKIPMNEIIGESIGLTDLVGAGSEIVVDRLREAKTSDQRFDTVEAFLLRMAREASEVNPLAREAIATLVQTHGCITVRDLASKLEVSQRNLRRSFTGQVGLGTKSFARIIRLQFVLDAIRNGSEMTLTDIAYEAGYFDQAHFIKDFQEFCGESPRSFARKSHPLSDAFV